jgi:hypothetical protein
LPYRPRAPGALSAGSGLISVLRDLGMSRRAQGT